MLRFGQTLVPSTRFPAEIRFLLLSWNFGQILVARHWSMVTVLFWRKNFRQALCFLPATVCAKRF